VRISGVYSGILAYEVVWFRKDAENGGEFSGVYRMALRPPGGHVFGKLEGHELDIWFQTTVSEQLYAGQAF
jgi:hypothetical protein